MRTNITGIDFEITDNIRNIVGEKFEEPIDRLLQHFDEEIKTGYIKINFEPKYKEYEVSFNMWLPGKKQIYASSNSTDLTAAIVELREMIERQVQTYTDQLNER